MPETIRFEGTEPTEVRSLFQELRAQRALVHGFQFYVAPPPTSITLLPEPRSLWRTWAAERFAGQARQMPVVQDVRLLSVAPELEVAVLLDTASLDRELELRGLFVDVMRSALDVTEGELFVYAADDAIPPHVAEAQPLAD